MTWGESRALNWLSLPLSGTMNHLSEQLSEICPHGVFNFDVSVLVFSLLDKRYQTPLSNHLSFMPRAIDTQGDDITLVSSTVEKRNGGNQVRATG